MTTNVFFSYGRTTFAETWFDSIRDLVAAQTGGEVRCVWDEHRLAEIPASTSNGLAAGKKLAPGLGELLRSSSLVVAFLGPGCWWRPGAVRDLPSWQAQELITATMLGLQILPVSFGGREEIVKEAPSEAVRSELESTVWLDVRERPDRASRNFAEIVAEAIVALDTPAPPNAQVELHVKQSQFYERFQELLRGANHRVEILGSGFSMRDLDSRRRAWSYLRVLAGCALRLELVRQEPTLLANHEWAIWVATYLGHLDQVQLHTYGLQETAYLFDVGMIDPGRETGWVEMMVPSRSGDESAGDFGIGVFLRSQSVSEEMWQIAKRRSNPDASDGMEGQNVRFLSAFRDLAVASRDQVATERLTRAIARLTPAAGGARQHLVFAYGSNMDVKQMQDRCPSAKDAGVGRLLDHRVQFKDGVIRQNAVATLTRTPGTRTLGILYEVDDLDLERLDFYEGVAPSELCMENPEYERRDDIRIQFLGQADDRTSVQAPIFVYVAKAAAVPVGDLTPSPEYRDKMLRGIRYMKDKYGHLFDGGDEGALKQLVAMLKT